VRQKVWRARCEIYGMRVFELSPQKAPFIPWRGWQYCSYRDPGIVIEAVLGRKIVIHLKSTPAVPS
jgi:hypothetical protein